MVDPSKIMVKSFNDIIIKDESSDEDLLNEFKLHHNDEAFTAKSIKNVASTSLHFDDLEAENSQGSEEKPSNEIGNVTFGDYMR